MDQNINNRNVGLNIWAPDDPAKSTCKINHHSYYQQSLWVKTFWFHLSLLCSKCIHLIPHDWTLPHGLATPGSLSTPPKLWAHLSGSTFYQPTENNHHRDFWGYRDLLTNVLLSISGKGCPLGPLELYSTGVGWGKFEGHTYKFTNISVSPSLWIPFIVPGNFWDLKLIICRSLLRPSSPFKSKLTY